MYTYLTFASLSSFRIYWARLVKAIWPWLDPGHEEFSFDFLIRCYSADEDQRWSQTPTDTPRNRRLWHQYYTTCLLTAGFWLTKKSPENFSHNYFTPRSHCFVIFRRFCAGTDDIFVYTLHFTLFHSFSLFLLSTEVRKPLCYVSSEVIEKFSHRSRAGLRRHKCSMFGCLLSVAAMFQKAHSITGLIFQLWTPSLVDNPISQRRSDVWSSLTSFELYTSDCRWFEQRFQSTIRCETVPFSYSIFIIGERLKEDLGGLHDVDVVLANSE